MIIGKVIGSVWSTRKDDKLNGSKFMIVSVIDVARDTVGDTIVAADIVGAGIGETVLVSTGGAARISSNIPIDAMIVGIVDSLEVE